MSVRQSRTVLKSFSITRKKMFYSGIDHTNRQNVATKICVRLEFYITKTCLYNFDPLKPQFYIVKLGFTGVYFIFLFLLKT